VALGRPRDATVAGLSAAALHGSKWIDPHVPAELFRRNGKPADGIVVHRDELFDDESRLVRGIRATTPARAAFDLGRRDHRMRALIAVDALANVTRLQSSDVVPLSERHRGVRGLVQLPEVLDLMDHGAESPQETRTRLLLIDAGLPRPQTQIVVRDDDGVPFARIDMGWEEYLVGVEYDGPQHWTDPSRRTRDIEKVRRTGRPRLANGARQQRTTEVSTERDLGAGMCSAAGGWRRVASYCTDFEQSRGITGHSTPTAKRVSRTFRTVRCRGTPRRAIPRRLGCRAHAAGTPRACRFPD
jgi:hypothetical protein